MPRRAQAWIGDVLECVVAPGEAAVVWRLLEAAQRSDWPRVRDWNAWFRASRETAELRAETEQTGGSLAKLLRDLDLIDAPRRGATADARAGRRCRRRMRSRRAASACPPTRR